MQILSDLFYFTYLRPTPHNNRLAQEPNPNPSPKVLGAGLRQPIPLCGNLRMPNPLTISYKSKSEITSDGISGKRYFISNITLNDGSVFIFVGVSTVTIN